MRILKPRPPLPNPYKNDPFRKCPGGSEFSEIIVYLFARWRYR